MINVSVIVPVFNEEKTLGSILGELLKVKEVTQIIVVDDGSIDRSVKVVKKFKDKKLILIQQRNQGKGAAIRKALEKVKHEYVLIQDADLEYHPEDIKLLIHPLEKRPNVKVVYGSRFLGPRTNLLFWHMLGNNILNLTVNVLYDTTLSDMETCYKLLPTALLKELNLTSNGFEIEPEITCKLLRKGHRIYEVPISYFGRDFKEGKKITWRDGFKALWSVVKYRFN